MPPAKLSWQWRCAQVPRKPIFTEVPKQYCQLKIKSIYHRHPGTQGLIWAKANLRCCWVIPITDQDRCRVALHSHQLLCFPLILVPPRVQPQRGLTFPELEERAQAGVEVLQLCWVMQNHCTNRSVECERAVHGHAVAVGSASSSGCMQAWHSSGSDRRNTLLSPVLLCPAAQKRKKTTHHHQPGF